MDDDRPSVAVDGYGAAIQVPWRPTRLLLHALLTLEPPGPLSPRSPPQSEEPPDAVVTIASIPWPPAASRLADLSSIFAAVSYALWCH